MKHFQYQTQGTCSRLIDFDLDETGHLHNVRFVGGCNGNLQGIGRLVEGAPAEQTAATLNGVLCGNKGTSCPDQLACAIRLALEQK